MRLNFRLYSLHKVFCCFNCKTQYLYISRHVQFYKTIFLYINDGIQQLYSFITYIIFSNYLESNNNMSLISWDLLISSFILNSICLPWNKSDSFPWIFYVVSTVFPSISPPPFILILTTYTNIHLMVARGKTDIFKSKTNHALMISYFS